MSGINEIMNIDIIQSLIFTFRGTQVMIDRDLAELYGVETKNLNKAVSRNIKRFPPSFRFQLTEKEFESLRFQSGTSNERGGRRYYPYVFTEQGIAMLSAILRSETAINISVQIMQAFVEMRHSLKGSLMLQNQIKQIEKQQIIFQLKTDQKFEKVLKAIQSKDAIPEQGIFFDGQIFDAYKLVSDIIRSAKKSIVLIDNYVDDTVLSLFSKKDKKVNCAIFTKIMSKQLKLDTEKFNEQYPTLILKQFTNAHDRFLIIDENQVYHIGASLKDLGKKWFGFSKMDKGSVTIISLIKGLL